jgi:hypothetical protein
MQHALDAMRARRRSIFFGSIFDEAETPEEPVRCPALDVPLTATSRDLETTAP